MGKASPSLDGKLVVGRIEEIKLDGGKSKIRFTAKEGSIWFPLVDATNVLSNLDVELKNHDIKRPYSAIKNNLGQAFQSIKNIHDSRSLDNWALEVLSKKMEFVSYRIADGTESAFKRAEKQITLGGSIFWDRWSLPRRLAERRELVADQALDKLLTNKIEESSLVWGIESPKYDEYGSYSQKEKDLAMRLNKYKSSTIE
jgi:hypothetical protein